MESQELNYRFGVENGFRDRPRWGLGLLGAELGYDLPMIYGWIVGEMVI